MASKRFSMRLKQLREAKGLSQAALADKVGVSREYIARLETGKHDPPLSRVEKLAKALGVGVVSLVIAGAADLGGQIVSKKTNLRSEADARAICVELERVARLLRGVELTPEGGKLVERLEGAVRLTRALLQKQSK
jgi:transcriptional regulator with XRE-family HTH domain